MKIRRYAVWLAAAVFILLLFWHAHPNASPSDAPTSALAAYGDYLALHGVNPEDILAYTITHGEHKTTLQLTLRSPDQQQRILSIAVQTP